MRHAGWLALPAGEPDLWVVVSFNLLMLNPAAERREGTGLGLATSAGVIREIDGRLTAENLPQGGAVFCIGLPALRGDQVPAPTARRERRAES